MADRAERFVVMSITREQIAKDLNDRLRQRQMSSPFFSVDDDRLTSRICGRYADGLPTDTEDPSHEWAVENLQDEILGELGVPLPDA
jgi:hypothetical protein